MAEAATPFIVSTVRPRFARVLNAWLDRETLDNTTYGTHAELKALRELMRQHSGGMEAVESILEYPGGL